MISDRVLCRYFYLEWIRVRIEKTIIIAIIIVGRMQYNQWNAWNVVWWLPIVSWSHLSGKRVHVPHECVERCVRAKALSMCFYDGWILFSGVWNEVKGIQLTNILNCSAIAWRNNETIELLRSCALQTHFSDYPMSYSFCLMWNT